MSAHQALAERVHTRMRQAPAPSAGEPATPEGATPGGKPAHWAYEPEHTDEVIRQKTGRSWDEWSALIEAAGQHTQGHTAIARYLRDEHGVDPWWAQSVTVGYERIAGIRAPYQRADGTFEASLSRTIAVDGAVLRAALLDEATLPVLIGTPATRRSKPEARRIRLAAGDGTVLIDLEERARGRVRVSLAHGGLHSSVQVMSWRAHWSRWFEALAEERADGST